MVDEPLEIELTIVPDPSAPPPPPPLSKKLHVGSRWRLVVAAAVVLLLGCAGFVLLRDEAPDPDAVLEDAQQAVAEVDAFEFRLEAAESNADGGRSINTELTDRFLASGKWSAERWSIRSTTNWVVAELLVDRNTTYSRAVNLAGGALGERLWTRLEAGAPGAENLVDGVSDEELRSDANENPVVIDAFGNDPARLGAAADVYLGPRLGGPRSRLEALSRWGYDRSPAGLLDVIEQMRPTSVTEGPEDSVVLRGRLQAAEGFEEAFGAPLPAARVALHLDSERVPTRLELSMRQGGSAFRLDVQFSHWSDPVVIDLPPAEEIDPTPTVDEDHLRAAAAAIDLVWPTAIPAGWEMSRLAVVLPDTPDGLGPSIVTRLCDAVVMEWTEPVSAAAAADESIGFLRLEMTPFRCAMALSSEAFVPDSEWGVPWRRGVLGFFEAQIGDTAVAVEYSAPEEAELDAVMRSFSRVDVDTVLAAAIAAAG